MQTKKQEKITVLWLLMRGYRPAQAARILGRSPQHVNAVLRGERKSRKLEQALRGLPKRALVGRELRKEVAV